MSTGKVSDIFIIIYDSEFKLSYFLTIKVKAKASNRRRNKQLKMQCFERRDTTRGLVKIDTYCDQFY